MYTPPHFALDTPEALHRIIRANPLGALVRHGEDGLDADHLPFEFEPGSGTPGTLIAHIARANPLWRRCANGTPVLVIFRGAQAYVSPNWYADADCRQVPTWNYEAVHVHGTLQVRDDGDFVRAAVERLTRRHEAALPSPWTLADAEPEAIERLLRAIVGIEIAIGSITGKAKLSQNKPERDRLAVADALAARGHDAIAAAMRDAQ